MGDCWYFAYGSNLDGDRMQLRTGPIGEAKRARLDGYRFAVNKVGQDKTGKANIMPDAGSSVWGVAYRCSQRILQEMDKYEGVSEGNYHRTTVQVVSDSGAKLDVVTYVAGDAFVCPSRAPSLEYLCYVLRGARQHGLPEEYVLEIERAARCQK